MTGTFYWYQSICPCALAIIGDISVSQTHLVCLLGFRGPTRDFFTHIIYHQYLWRAANFDQYSAVIVIKEWGFFRVIHLLWHGSYVYMVIQIKARDTHACWLAFGGGAVTICSNDRIRGRNLPIYPLQGELSIYQRSHGGGYIDIRNISVKDFCQRIWLYVYFFHCLFSLIVCY